jgi:hypothetical protein
MIDRRIAKIKIRRGTELERKSVIFEQGELVYTTDKKQVFIGDGNTAGGVPVSNKISSADNFPAISSPMELFFRTIDGRGYIYDGTTWQLIGGYTDDDTIEYNGGYKLKEGGIQTSHIGNVHKVNGGLSSTPTEGIFINYDTANFEVEDGVFKLTSAITGPQVSPTGAILNTPTGISINADNDTIQVSDNQIRLQRVYNDQIIGNITPNKVANSFANAASGISVDNNGIAIKTKSSELNFNNEGNLQLTPLEFSKSSNGYQIMQNGFVMQWGQTPGLSANKWITVTLPKTLAVCYNVQVTMGYSAIINNNFVPIIKNITTTSFDVLLDYSSTSPNTNETATIYWSALGYI